MGSPPDPSGESLLRGLANLKVSPTGPNDPASQLKARSESNGASSSDAPPGNSSEQRYTHFLCISPDAPTNPVLYWLGRYDASSSRFLLDEAKGPNRLDLGDVLYAPNTLIDPQVRRALTLRALSSHALWERGTSRPGGNSGG